MENCLFCKIIQGEIPAKKIHEDEHCVAFFDINPKAKTHVLIVPKKHIPTLMDLERGDERLMGHLFLIANKIGKSENLEGYHLQMNVGEKGGQEIFHIHVHLLAN